MSFAVNKKTDNNAWSNGIGNALKRNKVSSLTSLLRFNLTILTILTFADKIKK